MEKIISDDLPVADAFSKLFINIFPNLKVSTDHSYDNDFIATNDQVTNTVSKFRNHPSIIMIKNKNDQTFSFGHVTYDGVLKKVKTLDTAKASQQSDIPTKILKQNASLHIMRTILLTLYFAGKSAEFVVNNLEQSSTILFEWLNNGYMKVNTGKSHL